MGLRPRLAIPLRKERGIHAAFRSDGRETHAIIERAVLRPVKRPEGRAPPAGARRLRRFSVRPPGASAHKLSHGSGYAGSYPGNRSGIQCAIYTSEKTLLESGNGALMTAQTSMTRSVQTNRPVFRMWPESHSKIQTPRTGGRFGASAHRRDSSIPGYDAR